MYAECPPCPTLRAAFTVPVPTRRGNSKHIGVDARLIKQKRSWAGRRLVTGWTQQQTRARLDLALANKYSSRGRRHAELQPVLLVPTEANGTLDNACSLTNAYKGGVRAERLPCSSTHRALAWRGSELSTIYVLRMYVCMSFFVCRGRCDPILSSRNRPTPAVNIVRRSSFHSL